jgi:hypothetical protein
MLALPSFGDPRRKRGKVLREPGAGPGSMIVEGQQFSFSLTDLWQSTQPPKIGMIVEAEFKQDGKLVSIRAITARSGEQSRSRPAS